MFNFVKEINQKHKAKIEYWSRLKELLNDYQLSDKEKSELETLSKSLSLTPLDIKDIHKKALSLEWSGIVNDHIITEEEKNALQNLLKYFELDKSDFNFDQKTFNKFYALGQIQKGVLPVVEVQGLDIILKPNEKIHWSCPAALKKYKRVVQQISYRGPRASIRIMKGVSYRAGSYKISTQSKEVLATEDIGNFWLSNQRFGFEGQRKNFTLPYNKVLHFELTPDGLVIAKEGRENPYLVALDDYEVPAAILSNIINQ